MRRREFIIGLWATFATQLTANAQQQSGKTFRVGYLGFGTGTSRGSIALQQSFVQGLRNFGWIEGQNVAIEYRFAEGRDHALPSLVQELVGRGLDVIVAYPTPAVLAAKNATTTVPIVGIGLDNPIQNGLIASLARPGGNITGLTYSAGPEIFGKHLELLKEVVPAVTDIAVLSNSGSPNHAITMENVGIAGTALKVRLLFHDVRDPSEFEAAFKAMAKEGADALFVFGDPMFGVHGKQLAELASEYRLAAIYTNRPFVEAGGLMSYAPSFSDLWGRA